MAEPDSENRDGGRQSSRFLYLYALAVCGGSIAYIPFLTILLPLHATRIAGDGALTLLAHAAFVGAIAASLSAIGFGWVSDRIQARTPWIICGLGLSSALLVMMQWADSPLLLLGMIVGWQVCLNMMLAPLAAWAGDCVPDRQKGLLGGLLAFAPALGALSGAAITLRDALAPPQQLPLIAVLVILCVTPVLIAGRPRPMPHLMQRDQALAGQSRARVAVRRMWLTRLFVQIAEASLFAFLLLWFRSVEPRFSANDVATIFSAVLCLSVLCTLAVGRWSDRADRPILPLAVCAGCAAAGLLIMAIAPGLTLAIAGYALFGLASGVFLALHTSQTLRVLPTPQTRGRDLGLFNLTNTVPSLIMPWLTLALVPLYGFDALFVLLAVLALAACGLLATMPRSLTR